MSIPGKATAEATGLLAGKKQNLPESAYTVLGKTGLKASRIGFGSYRCYQDSETHRDALQQALHSGCNLIDTSANYTDGSAEALIGELLNEAIVWNGSPREQYVVVSKAGYLQGENYQIALEKEQGGEPFPEVVKYQSGLWHCIHPDFLEDQITRSLARTHLDTLDVYLLHNPEYFLMAEQSQAGDVSGEFYDRLRRAFISLEKMVDEGLIAHYGISSNGLPLPAEAPEFVDLARVWQSYQDACLQLGKSTQEGHFAVIQLPLNWLEESAATRQNVKWQGQASSVLQLAKKLDLAVLTNRPLNAFQRNRLVRLATYGFDDNIDYNARLQHKLQQLQAQEDLLRSQMPSIALQQQKQFNALFNAAAQLQQLAGQFYDISRLRELLQQQFVPFVKNTLKTVSADIAATGEGQLQQLADFEFAFADVCRALIGREDARNYEQLRHLNRSFDQQALSLKSSASFAQKALKVLLDTEGVDVVLCGMRRPEYVDEALKVLESEHRIDGTKLLNWRETH